MQTVKNCCCWNPETCTVAVTAGPYAGQGLRSPALGKTLVERLRDPCSVWAAQGATVSGQAEVSAS